MLVLVMLTGAWMGVVGLPGGSEEPPVAYAESAPVIATEADEAQTPMFGSLDIGRALGLSAGMLEIRPDALGLLAQTEIFLSSTGRFQQPLKPEDVSDRFSVVAEQENFHLAPAHREALVWRDSAEDASGFSARAARALNAYASALDAQDTFAADLDRDFPGGADGFRDLMTRLAGNEALSNDERSLLDAWIERPSTQQAIAAVALARTLVESVATDVEAMLASQDAATQAGLPAAAPKHTGSPGDAALELARQIQAGGHSTLEAMMARSIRESGLTIVRPDYTPRIDVRQAMLELAAANAVPLAPEDIEALDAYVATLRPAEAAYLATVIGALASAEVAARATTADLTSEDWMAAKSIVEDLLAGREVETERLAQAHERVDIGALLGAAWGLTAAIEQAARSYTPSQQAAGGPPFFSYPSNPNFLQIGSLEGETFSSKSQYALDLGGDDAYLARYAGGDYGSVLGCYVVACVPNPTASGFFNLLIDLFGDDRYDAGTVPSMSGAFGAGGYFTAGMLFDFAGDDTYKAALSAYGGAFAGGYGSIGAFADYSGHDSYTVTAASSSFHFAFGTGYYASIGYFLDVKGNDVYSMEYGYGFGAAPYLGVGEFIDGQGNDKYSKTGGYGYYAYGSSSLGKALFIDASGTDSYKDDAYAGTSFGYTFFILGSTAVGSATFVDVGGADSYPTNYYGRGGNDRATIGPATYVDWASAQNTGPALDLQLDVRGPLPRFKVAPGGTARFTLAVTNFGSAPLQDVEATGVIYTRDDDIAFQGGSNAPAPITGGPLVVSFGSVSPGTTVVRTVDWTAPVDNRVRLLAAEFTAVSHEPEPVETIETIDFTLQAVRDIRVSNLFVTANGRTTPSTLVNITGRAENFGNVNNGALPVTLSITPITPGLTYSYSTTTTISLPAPATYYDGSLASSKQNLLFPWTSPTQQGDYLVTLSVPSTGTINDACQTPSATCTSYTSMTRSVSVIRIVDAKVTPAVIEPVVDPDFWEGPSFTVQNIGTDRLNGQLNITMRKLGVTTPVSVQPFSITIDPGKSTTIRAKVPTPRPKYEETWTFEAYAWVPDEKAATIANNLALSRTLFRGGIIFMDDFEQDNPSVVSQGGCSSIPQLWRRATPTYRGQHSMPISAYSGTSVWATHPTSAYCDGVRGDLVYRNLDLTMLMSPARIEFMSAVDTFRSGSAAYTGGFVSVAPAGTTNFVQVPLQPSYPCSTAYPYPFTDDYYKPMMCGTQSWTKYTVDLSNYAGQKVDVRFRYDAYSCCFNSGRAGWMIDDLALYGTRRLPGDVEIVSVTPSPNPALKGRATFLDVTVRNVGLVPVNVTGSAKAFVGTTSRSLTIGSASLLNLAGGSTGVLRMPFVATEAKKYNVDLVKVNTTNIVDPRPGNNFKEDMILDVYALISSENFETLSSCPPECEGWTHASSPSGTTDEWEFGTPKDYPTSAFSGASAWATDLDGPYDQGTAYSSCCYGTARYHKLTSPPLALPTMDDDDVVEGDTYALGFKQAYWLSRPANGMDPDLAYVVARSESAPTKVLTPTAGYPYSGSPPTCYYWSPYSECGEPPSNLGFKGWTGKSNGWEGAVLPLPKVMPGAEFAFDFILYSQYRSNVNDAPRPGWSIDDVAILRQPRFDYDLAVTGLSPVVFNASAPNTAYVIVENLGRRNYDPDRGKVATVTLTLDLPAGKATYSTILPIIEKGETKQVAFPFQAPDLFFGVTKAAVDLQWADDEWNKNDDLSARDVRFGWVFYQSDFERDQGSFDKDKAPTGDGGSSDGIPWKHGAPPDRSPLQGSASWYTGPLGAGAAGALTGPRIDLRTGSAFKLKSVNFEGSMSWDGGSNGLICSYNGFRLVDRQTDQVLQMRPAFFTSVYWWNVGSVHCGGFNPLNFNVDLTNRQADNYLFQPRFDIYTALYDFYFYIGPNRGAEIDRLAVYGQPYDSNLVISKFLGPSTLVGPGEPARVQVNVANGGIVWPSAPVGVQFLSNDNPSKPSLSVVRPISAIPFAGTKLVETTWEIPRSLNGQVVKLTARLVTQTPAGQWVPFSDEVPVDNVLEQTVSVVAVHDLSIKVNARPSLDPQHTITSLIETSIENRGTLSEDGVRLSLRILDEQGSPVYESSTPTPMRIAPAYWQAAKKPSPLLWTPPQAGHYKYEAALVFPNQAEDVVPTDNVASGWIHAGRLPYRSGDSFDGETSEFTASGGFVSAQGFSPVVSSEAPEGNVVLQTNPRNTTYEPTARYRHDMIVDMAGAVAPRMSFKHKYDLGAGDVVRVLASTDRGASWTVLQPVGGYGATAEGYTGSSGAWRAVAIDLSSYRAGYTRFRFELKADATGQGKGWSLDDVKIEDSGKRLFAQGFEPLLGQVLQSWDFESGSGGWSADASDLSINDWQRGIPTYGVLDAHSGKNVWKTRLDAPYSTAAVGHRYLRSPQITLPTDKESLTFGWWQNYIIQYGAYYWDGSPYPYYSDAGVVQLKVGTNNPIIVKPTTGYPMPTTNPTVGSSTGFTGTSRGWEFRTIDLTPYAGQTVQLIFDFANPSYDGDWTRSYYVSGAKGGWAIDDVTVFGKAAVTAPAGYVNYAVTKVTVPVIGNFETSRATATLRNDGAPARVKLEWEWVGPRGAILSTGSRNVDIPTGGSTHNIDLPEVETAQPAVLRVTVDGAGDQRGVDDTYVINAPILDVMMRQDFETAPPGGGTWPCASTSPCAGWKHAKWTSSSYMDEWGHGTIPPNKYPGAAHSGSYAFGTDISQLSPSDQDLVVSDAQASYSFFSDTYLQMPAFQVPASGGSLRFWHAMHSYVAYAWAYDGGQVWINGQLAHPVGKYPAAPDLADGSCYWPIYAPCYWGQFDWREAEFSLDPWKGQTVDVRFRYVSDYYYNPPPGWVLDDFIVTGNPPLPNMDVALTASPVVRFDPRYPYSYSVGLNNPGLTPSSLLDLVVDYYRDGEVVETMTLTVPALKVGESRSMPVPLPVGSVQGLEARLRLESRDGGAPDDNPMNDLGATLFEPFESLYVATFEDGQLPVQSEKVLPENQFIIGSSPAAAGAPGGKVLVAGFKQVPLSKEKGCQGNVPAQSSGCNFFSLPPMFVPHGAKLEFDHFYKFSMASSGANVEISTDGQRWRTVDPIGGYPNLQCGWSGGYYYYGRCFQGTPSKWSHVTIPLDDFGGQVVNIRFKYTRSSSTPVEDGWAIDNILLRGPIQVESLLEQPRFERGPIKNPDGPVMTVSGANVYGTGLKKSTSRALGWDILDGPSVDLSRIPNPTLSFDYWLDAELGAATYVQVLDPAGNWIEVARLPDTNGFWSHREYALKGVAHYTQVRFVYATAGYASEDPYAGLFVDDVLIGSLTAKIERRDVDTVLRYTAQDGQNLTVPIRVTNTGSFTNSYAFKVRGPDPFWTGVSSPETIKMEPGESRNVDVTISIPFGGDPGDVLPTILAESLFDPLQRSAYNVPVRLKVSPRPDWNITLVDLMVKTTAEDGTWVLQDAQPNNLVVLVVNEGRAQAVEQPRIVLYEHTFGKDGTTKGGDRRAFNTTYLEDRPANVPKEVPYQVNVSWMPRKDVWALEIVVNPNFELAEEDKTDNVYFRKLDIKPRALPELELSEAPGFAKQPRADESTSVGLNVINSGGTATANPVDVALLAGYTDGFLVSPVVNLLGNDVLKMRYAADLEPRVDAVVLEAKAEGTGVWTKLQPKGGYPYGCVLALECSTGISGNTGGRVRELTFDLKPLVGETQFRLRFAMDASNGRVYEGFQVQRLRIQHFTSTVVDYNFAKSTSGWTAGGLGMDGHSWTYRPTEGSSPGAWMIPRDYQNPYTVGLRQVPQGVNCPPCLAAGARGFAELEWTPNGARVAQLGGDFPLVVYIDPRDLQPEYTLDYNRYAYNVRVLTNGFEVKPKEEVVVSGAHASRSATLTFTNTGNHDGVFDVMVREGNALSAKLVRDGRDVKQVILGEGQSIDLDLALKAKAASAGVHYVYIDVADRTTDKMFAFGIPVRVDTGFLLPTLEETGPLTMRQKVGKTLLVQNPGNAPIQVILRVVDKPSGLAAKPVPDEFTLGPFESRAVEFEFLNLGAKPGTYKVGLINAKVVCANGALDCSRFADLSVVVEPYGLPAANIKLDAASYALGQAVRFQDASTATGSKIAAWKWDFGDGTTSTEQSPVHAYARPGVYEAKLRVTDSEGQWADSPPVLVAVVNHEPRTVARVMGPESPRAGQLVNFSAAESLDTDGGIVEITWAFGDGQLAHGANVSHAFANAGTYRITVAVEDGFGAVSVQTLTVTVLAAEDIKAKEEPRAKGSAAGPGLLLVLMSGVLGVWGRRARRKDLPCEPTGGSSS